MIVDYCYCSVSLVSKKTLHCCSGSSALTSSNPASQILRYVGPQRQAPCSCDDSWILKNCKLVFLGSFPSPSNGVGFQTLWHMTTESQGYLDKLVSDGRTTPRAFLSRNSTFRIKCGDDGFRQVSHQSSTGDLHRARTEVLRVSYTGDNFANMSSVLTQWLFGEMPNSYSYDEFSERLQVVLFTPGMSKLPSTTPPQTYDACRVSW